MILLDVTKFYHDIASLTVTEPKRLLQKFTNYVVCITSEKLYRSLRLSSTATHCRSHMFLYVSWLLPQMGSSGSCRHASLQEDRRFCWITGGVRDSSEKLSVSGSSNIIFAFCGDGPAGTDGAHSPTFSTCMVPPEKKPWVMKRFYINITDIYFIIITYSYNNHLAGSKISIDITPTCRIRKVKCTYTHLYQG